MEPLHSSHFIQMSDKVRQEIYRSFFIFEYISAKNEHRLEVSPSFAALLSHTMNDEAMKKVIAHSSFVAHIDCKERLKNPHVTHDFCSSVDLHSRV